MAVAHFDSNRARDLGRAVHEGYHIALISRQYSVSCQVSDRPVRILASTIRWSVQTAKAWCRTSFDEGSSQGAALIRARLPDEWAKSPKRRALALRAFEELCEDSASHEYGRLPAVARELGCSVSTLELHRLDFFVFVAVCALDDETWELAMKEESDEGESSRL